MFHLVTQLVLRSWSKRLEHLEPIHALHLFVWTVLLSIQWHDLLDNLVSEFEVFERFYDGAEAEKSDYASLSENEWKKRLTPEQYYITRQKGTERAFTGYVMNTHRRLLPC